MKEREIVAGWRGLSLAVGKRTGRPVGVGAVRWRVENSGLPIGEQVGGVLLFSESDVARAAELVAAKEAGQPATAEQGTEPRDDHE